MRDEETYEIVQTIEDSLEDSNVDKQLVSNSLNTEPIQPINAYMNISENGLSNVNSEVFNHVDNSDYVPRRRKKSKKGKFVCHQI